MSGLFHTLTVGSEALLTTRQGVDTAGHNIANAQVEGFSRQQVNIRQNDPLESHGVLIGNGASLASVSRSHDQFVENQLNNTYQDSGRSAARADSLKSIERVFSPELNSSVSDQVTRFFNSLQTLSSFPTDETVRTTVVETGRDAVSAFRRVDSDLKENRKVLNERIFDMTGKMTEQLKEIAKLNVKIQTSETGQGAFANDLRDQRDRLVRDLSGQVEIKYYEDQYGMLCIRGPDQVTLVEGRNSAKFGVIRNFENDGLYDVTITDWDDHHARNVTNRMEGGSLEAFIQVRDKDITGLLSKNNQMAHTFASEVNRVHQFGYGIGDYAESTGRNFFKVPLNVADAAADLDVDDAIQASAHAISAASSALAPGDNINVNSMIKLKDAKIFADENNCLNEFYANFTANLGMNTQRAEHARQASDLLVKDLNKQRESVAGVSLDEEATNMMKWQANFTASSKVITTIDEMLDTVLSMKR
ncbi:MAG: flagellar hook-associated protein FlgK [Proteobacteria bacterium]|nr:flagellar hook-associated protein FlgK [Pseudomonadota bacterium]